MPGKVHIVGAGPGSPDLLTLRAARLLGCAQVVLHDDLVSSHVLQLVPATAEIVNVGKRRGTRETSQQKIHALMIWHAQNGRDVVRLKSGDPAIFGRLGEELDALRNAGIECEVVPGVTAASAGAAAAKVTLTDRRAASILVFLTAHNARDESLALGNANPDKTTYVVYMPGPDYGKTAHALIGAGVSADTPCALVSNAGRNEQQVCRITIADLPFAAGVVPPSLLIVGRVA
ncbi:MAG TPA: uroporphyrinogen-III C-methyltransferase, partial [Terriglobales bacterium]|nr:uroporphyrinogen-III C-methyltransferase [Terriglobales bacterium]